MLTLQEVASGVPPTLDSLLARFAFTQLLDASAPPAETADGGGSGAGSVGGREPTATGVPETRSDSGGAATPPPPIEPTPVFRGRATSALARLAELSLDDGFGSMGEVR